MPANATSADRPPADESARIRDRYIAARFPGVVRRASDLRSCPRVLDAARGLLAEGSPHLAAELLELSALLCPSDKALRLAQLEVAYLDRDSRRFVALARRLRNDFPDCHEWPQIRELARSLTPATEPAPSARNRAWPDPPHWMDSPLDLAAQVRASDFQNTMERLGACGQVASARFVAGPAPHE